MAVIRENGSAALSNVTNPAAGTIQWNTARVLRNQGKVELFTDPDGTRQARLTEPGTRKP
jgi:hypothetical protein